MCMCTCAEGKEKEPQREWKTNGVKWKQCVNPGKGIFKLLVLFLQLFCNFGNKNKNLQKQILKCRRKKIEQDGAQDEFGEINRNWMIYGSVAHGPGLDFTPAAIEIH